MFRSNARVMPAASRVIGVVVVAILALSPFVVSYVDRALDASSAEVAGGSTAARFKIRGTAKGLYPGATMMMRLRLSNPNAYAIRVQRLWVTVGKSNRKRCPASALTPAPSVKRSKVVQPGGVARTRYPMTMGLAAPDRCRGARWDLLFGGRAIRVPR